MSQPDSDEAPVFLCDVAGYFSQDEWKLLHEWQKELYKNVMKEIHQALISLGPIIATTVFSLRAEEKRDLCPVVAQQSERRHGLNRSPIFSSLSTDSFLRMEEESTACLMDHLGDEVAGSSTGPSSKHAGTRPVVSFIIKEEEEDSYSMDDQHYDRTEDVIRRASKPVVKSVFSLSYAPKEDIHSGERTMHQQRTTGDGSMNKEHNERYSAVCTEKTTFRTLSEKAKAKVLHTSGKVNNSMSQLWPEGYQEPREKTNHCKSNFINPASSHQGTPKEEGSDKLYECESNRTIGKLPICKPSTLKNWQPYVRKTNFITKHHLNRHNRTHTDKKPFACTECEKSFRQKASLIEHQRTHTGQRPFQCTECGKSFSRKRSLIVHQRLHMGKKPYQCTECEKHFNHERSLFAHQRTHIVETRYQCTECEKHFSHERSLVAHQKTHMVARRYQCTECEKNFRQMASLIEHQRTHTGQRPYQCTECEKSFSRKRSLVVHWKLHT